MTSIESEIFSRGPSYEEAYRFLRGFEERYRLRLEIGRKIERRIGLTIDNPKLYLGGHADEILLITKKVVGGEIRQEKTGKKHTKIINLGILEAHITSPEIHSYVLDDDGKVWNPYTGAWGIMSEEEYYRKKISKNP